MKPYKTGSHTLPFILLTAFGPGVYLAFCAFLFSACSDSSTDTGGVPGPAPATISFTLNGLTVVQYSGTAVWPPSGRGVIAGIDGGAGTLQLAGYTQISPKTLESAGPEPTFNFVYIEVDDTAGIAARSYSDFEMVIGLNIALNDIDSGAYFGSSGTLTLTTVSDDRVEGTFSGSLTRPTDFDVITVGGGAISAPLGSGLFAFEDSGSTGGNIPVSADTGTTPAYSWSGGPVNAVGVSRVSDPNSLVWGVFIAGKDSIVTGMIHGQVPAGALQVGTEPVLTAGVAYRVRVSRTDGRYGYTDFIP